MGGCATKDRGANGEDQTAFSQQQYELESTRVFGQALASLHSLEVRVITEDSRTNSWVTQNIYPSRQPLTTVCSESPR